MLIRKKNGRVWICHCALEKYIWTMVVCIMEKYDREVVSLVFDQKVQEEPLACQVFTAAEPIASVLLMCRHAWDANLPDFAEMDYCGLWLSAHA